LHQSYGPRAAASINAIQGSRPQPPNGQHMTAQQYQMMQQQRAANGMQQAQARGPGQPGQGPGQPPPMSQEQYKAMMARQAAGQMQHVAANIQNGQNGVGGAQTDGAGDEVEGLSVIKQFGPNGEEMSMGRVEIDSLLRSKIEAMSTRMEGGGLMLPLKQASTAKLRKSKSKSSNAVSAMAQVDGGDDDDDDVKDEEVDEDAINSDLDDPEDTVNDEEDEDEGMGHIMLCMYDKVQRVKNKW
jgi:transcription initiation factor TFIIA large subunit